ncbi:MAG: hypothetical protein ABIR96_03305 [Bdellovibrionota bacterium]
MRHFHTWVCFVLLASSVSCVAPVRRDGGPKANRTRISKDETSPEIPHIEGLKKRIWVLDLRVTAPIPEALNQIDFRQTFRDSISDVFLNDENSAFVPVVTDQTVLMDLKIDSFTDPMQVSRVGRGSGIAGFLRGEIHQLDITEKKDPTGLIQSRDITVNIGVSYELVDAASGRTLISGNRKKTFVETRSEILGYATGLADSEKKIRKMADSIAQWMLKDLNPYSSKIGWSGRILKLEGQRLYLNAGRSSGLRIGDILKVVEVPRDVFDTQSGRFIGQAPGRVKGTCKVIDYFGLDGAVGMLQSGGGLAPGDRVELF